MLIYETQQLHKRWAYILTSGNINQYYHHLRAPHQSESRENVENITRDEASFFSSLESRAVVKV